MKRTFQKIVCLLLAAVMAAGAAPLIKLVPAAVEGTDAQLQTQSKERISLDGQWKYKVIDEDSISSSDFPTLPFAVLTRYLGDEETVIVPETLDELPVYVIAGKCFNGENDVDAGTDENIDGIDAVKHIFISSTVCQIGQAAFAYMDALESVTFSQAQQLNNRELYLGTFLFKESPRLETLELPEHLDYLFNYNLLAESYIKRLTIPADSLWFNYGTEYLKGVVNSWTYTLGNFGIGTNRVEHLTLTGDFAIRTTNSDDVSWFELFGSPTLQTVEFMGEVLDNAGESATALSTAHLPDLVFHRSPSLNLEKQLEKTGYIRTIDAQAGTVAFSVNGTPDARFTPVTESRFFNMMTSGRYAYEYALTAAGDAVILDYFGSEDPLVYPSEIEGHTVIAIENKNQAWSTKTARAVTIPAGVEYIGRRAFYNWSKLETVNFPDRLKTIDSEAFSHCAMLREMTLPEITYLGCEAFRYCSPSRIVIPATLKQIPRFAFNGAYDSNPLEALIISEGVESIGWGAFKNNEEGAETQPRLQLSLPSTVNYIGRYAFENGNYGGELRLPENIEVLNCGVFSNNRHLTSIILPAGLKCILESAFEGCVLQNPLTVPRSIARIDPGAFQGLTAPTVHFERNPVVICVRWFRDAVLESLVLPDGLYEIQNEAFKGAAVGELILPNSVTVFGNRYASDCFAFSRIGRLSFGSRSEENRTLFQNAVINELVFTEGTALIPASTFKRSEIHKVTLNGTATVSDSAFVGCSIRELTIGEDVAFISGSAFSGCTALEKIVFAARRCTYAPGLLADKPALASFEFGENVEYIPEGMFQNSSIVQTIVIPQTVTRIYDSAFEASAVTQVDLPPRLELIGNACFADCERLTSITIPASVTALGSGAFSECWAMEQVEFLPESCVVLPGDRPPFEDCPALSFFRFGDQIKDIPDNLLKNCTGLESVTIPDSVTDIGAYAFAGSGLKTVVIPKNIESIGDGCFKNCAALETVVFSGDLLLIGDGAFSGCDRIREIYIADSVRDIGKASFAGCTSLETVYLSRNVVYVPERCFENCTALSSFAWEADSKLIGKLAFHGCTALTSFNFIGIEKLYPNSFAGSGVGVVTLGEARDEAAAALEIVEAQSFMGCEALQTVALGGNVSTVQTQAFANCENLETALISDSVKTISPDAFQNCPKLTIYCTQNSYAYDYATSNGIPVSTFVIEPIPNQRYTGRAIEPAVQVSVSGQPLAIGTDFRVRYSNNINVGTASVKVTGLNDYRVFSSTVGFVILTREIAEAVIEPVADQSYTGSAVTPALHVTYNGKTLRAGTDYEVCYADNTAAGKAKVTVTGVGNFSGTTIVQFNIVESQSGGSREGLRRLFTAAIAFFRWCFSAVRSLFAGR